MKQPSHLGRALLGLALVLILAQGSGAYSVLTHEQVVDLLWADRIQPMVKARFPDLIDKQLREAHAYAYGGSLVQDMGYYPFGSRYFSDLTHYVRTGDFVTCLIQESQTANEYAFALGALAHYAADNSGHPTVNHVVAQEFPALQRKYGDVVTYADSPKAHIRAEFGFDMTQVAKNRYTSDGYHDFIGFGVSVPLLEQAFQETYGLDLKTVLTDEDKVLGSYRHAVSQLLPKATRIAWSLKKEEILKDQPSMTRKKFLYNLSRASYQKNWGKNYQPPTRWERFLAFLTRILPKVGPLKVLQLKTPTPAAEKLFEASFNATLDRYRQLLSPVGVGQPDLPNDNFDTGAITGPGIYRLNDETHARLLDALAKQNFSGASLEVRAELLEFYGHPDAPYATKRKPKDWAKVQVELEQLKKAAPPVVPTAADGPVQPVLSSE